MKKIVFLLTIISMSTASLFAQAGEGMTFHSGTWAAALETAAKENKLVFLDAYTTWCGPCKKMSRETFTQPAVGEYFNKNFINVKMDMEKGEGVRLAQAFNVMVYPTLLFISPDGAIVHRSAGYHTTEQFLELGAIANDPSKRMSAMDKRYKSGDRDPDFLLDYAMTKYEVQDGSHEGIAEEYMNTQKDWGTEDNMKMIFNFMSSPDSKLFQYVLDNKKAFYNLVGESKVTQSIQGMIFSQVKDGDAASTFKQIDNMYKKIYPEKAEKLSAQFRPAYYRQVGDRANYATSQIEYFKKYPTKDWEELNEAAWTFYRVVEDKKQLKKGLKWAKKSVKLNSQFINNDTVAALYFKLKKKKKAMKYANKAIALAKESGNDYADTEKLLEDIKAM